MGSTFLRKLNTVQAIWRQSSNENSIVGRDDPSLVREYLVLFS